MVATMASKAVLAPFSLWILLRRWLIKYLLSSLRIFVRRFQSQDRDRAPYARSDLHEIQDPKIKEDERKLRCRWADAEPCFHGMSNFNKDMARILSILQFATITITGVAGILLLLKKEEPKRLT